MRPVRSTRRPPLAEAHDGVGWCALDHATRATTPRVPFVVCDRAVGSVATAHLPALQAFGDLLRFDASTAAVRLQARAPAACTAALERMNRALRAGGPLIGWRNEIYPVVDPQGLAVLARTERAAARFWGLLTFGTHATGYVAGADGRPALIWVARRAASKSTDPGLHDNLIGGGIAFGETPRTALVREGAEEAGLAPGQLAGARSAGVLGVKRDTAAGLQHEWLHSFDVELPAATVPMNTDGEVAGFELLPVADALALAAGRTMTVDAALVTIDFALRHGLLDDDAVRARIDALRVAGAGPLHPSAETA